MHPQYHLSHSCNHSFTPFVLPLTLVSAKETENQSRAAEAGLNLEPAVMSDSSVGEATEIFDSSGYSSATLVREVLM